MSHPADRRPHRRPARRRAVTAVVAALVVLTAAGCSGEGEETPELSVVGAFVPEPVSEAVAGGFLTVRNDGEVDDHLISVSSDLAGTVELHETVDNTMRRVDRFVVPAGGELTLSRGGNHLMLLDLSHRPVEGETVSLELHFETSEPIGIDVPVEAGTHTGR
ncbi:copper chaperone PCu(A)C [Streptomyces sp. ST2-7A]|uniref:copper chaperone PCu(A)C n=1 Tax=Streptomyces sp. ST2-7A TaxID=2907214 RepID=UPI001F342B69|nr:copper chaperone PCu(A)C [Streptomyces sp. ST2-7A]MCE7083390.1 copper chaperone PCu(A)C [Streptomyces sp. ST2-7A]